MKTFTKSVVTSLPKNREEQFCFMVVLSEKSIPSYILELPFSRAKVVCIADRNSRREAPSDINKIVTKCYSVKDDGAIKVTMLLDLTTIKGNKLELTVAYIFSDDQFGLDDAFDI